MTRFGYVIATYIAVLGVAVASCVPTSLRLVWNASASTPVGLYAVEPASGLEVTDLVALRAPEPLATFLADSGYLPRDIPLMKRVAALPGQLICRNGRTVSVDGIDMADALDRDRIGRPLPVWQGCRRVGDDELFLLNWQVPDSLDGRYFGPLPASAVIGRAIPLYTDEDGGGRFVWRAPTR